MRIPVSLRKVESQSASIFKSNSLRLVKTNYSSQHVSYPAYCVYTFIALIWNWRLAGKSALALVRPIFSALLTLHILRAVLISLHYYQLIHQSRDRHRFVERNLGKNISRTTNANLSALLTLHILRTVLISLHYYRLIRQSHDRHRFVERNLGKDTSGPTNANEIVILAERYVHVARPRVSR